MLIYILVFAVLLAFFLYMRGEETRGEETEALPLDCNSLKYKTWMKDSSGEWFATSITPTSFDCAEPSSKQQLVWAEVDGELGTENEEEFFARCKVKKEELLPCNVSGTPVTPTSGPASGTPVSPASGPVFSPPPPPPTPAVLPPSAVFSPPPPAPAPVVLQPAPVVLPPPGPVVLPPAPVVLPPAPVVLPPPGPVVLPPPAPPTPWTIGPWSDCSKKCGNGVQTRTVTCLEGGCTDRKPETSKACNIQSCAWVLGDWSDCSKKCGNGVQTRTVTCPAGGCTDIKPDTSKACNNKQCDWVVGNWEACTKECDGGSTFRTVYCPEPGQCLNSKPDEYATCNQQPCKRDYEEHQGWCRNADGQGSEPPFLWDRSGSIYTKRECQLECDKNPWCFAYGWGPNKVAVERCRLHGRNLNELRKYGKFTSHAGMPTGCPKSGDGNSSSYCYVKKAKMFECD